VRRLAIAFSYDDAGIVDDYMLHLVAAMSEFVEHTIFVSNGLLSRESKRAVDAIAQQVIIRENVGYDVGAYKAALETVGFDTLATFDEIILHNHTFYGPIFPFREMFSEMEKRDCDFWGITDHKEVTPNPLTQSGILHRHIQSHFIAIRQRMVSSKEFRLYWEMMPVITGYLDSILTHEVRFTHHFEKLGYKSSVYIDANDYDSENPTFINVDQTIERRCPILKRRVFFHDPVFHDVNAIDLPRALRFIERHSDYDLDLIWRSIIRTTEPGTLNANAARASIFPDIRLKQSDAPPQIGRLAVCMHVYYMDMLPELAALLQNIPIGFDLIATTDRYEKQIEIETAFSGISNMVNLVVRVPEVNRGRDMGAMFVACRDLFADDRYDLVCRLHTKKSVQDGAARGRFFKHHLQENLLNSSGYVANVVDMFADNPSIGVAVAPIVHRGYPTLGHSWFANREKVESIVDRLRLKVRLDPDTPLGAYGGMYWFRPRALRKLFAYPWCWEDFDAEPKYGDGDLPHALERLICYVAQDAGYLTQQIMVLHQAELQCTSLEFKLQHLCALLPDGSLRSQRDILLAWRGAGFPVSPTASTRLGSKFLTELCELIEATDEAGPSPAVRRRPNPGEASAGPFADRDQSDGTEVATQNVSDLVRELAISSSLTLARRARHSDNDEVAARFYRDALRRQPDDAPSWVEYADLLESIGRLTEAEYALLTALSFDGPNPDTQHRLGRVLQAQGKRERAEKAYLRAFVLGSSPAAIIDGLAQFGWTAGSLAELRLLLKTEFAEQQETARTPQRRREGEPNGPGTPIGPPGVAGFADNDSALMLNLAGSNG
jgi:lipopolysaccharide biosynthesis protein